MQEYATTQKGGRTLMTGLVGSRGDWFAYAVETDTDGFNADTPDKVLEDHAHDVIARNVGSKRLARFAAEKYMRAWRRGTPLPPCACGPIKVAT